MNIVPGTIGDEGGRKGSPGQIFATVDNMRRIETRSVQVGIMAGAAEQVFGLYKTLCGIRG